MLYPPYCLINIGNSLPVSRPEQKLLLLLAHAQACDTIPEYNKKCNPGPCYTYNMRTVAYLLVGIALLLLIITFWLNTKAPVAPPTPLPTPGPLLGISITDGALGFDEAYAVARSAGTQVYEVPLMWAENEIAPGKFKNPLLPIINNFYPQEGMYLGLTLNPIDTTALQVPEDLATLPFDDSRVIERFKQFVDFVAASLPDTTIVYVAIGNEVDGRLASTEDWEQYTNFVKAVAPPVREKFPSAVVGTKITFSGLTGKTKKEALALNTYTDAVLTTYYPFVPDSFSVKPPSAVPDDFKLLLSQYPSKQLYFTEIGYPSGEENGSSEAQQADFVRTSLTAWDSDKARILLMNFVWLHDLNPNDIAGYEQYYGISDPGFISYLATLGLRTYDGNDKPAFQVLSEHSNK
jgi:hypothetical protein